MKASLRGLACLRPLGPASTDKGEHYSMMKQMMNSMMGIMMDSMMPDEKQDTMLKMMPEMMKEVKGSDMLNILKEELFGMMFITHKSRFGFTETIQKIKNLFTMCASCKKIRVKEGSWEKIEDYIRKYTNIEFSHTICPECAKVLYPNMPVKKREKHIKKKSSLDQ